METIYSGIKNTERVLTIGKAIADGAPINEVCKQFGVRKKTAISYKEKVAAMQSHEISITDGQNSFPLARIVVVGGGGSLPRPSWR